MFSKKKKDEHKDRSKEPVKDGHKSDKSDKEKEKHVAHSQSSTDPHSHHKDKSDKSRKGKESDKEKDKVSNKASASSKESLAAPSSSKSNKELKHEHTSSKKFKKSSSAPVFIPKKGDVSETPAVVDDELYDFLCDPTNCDDGPKLKFKSKPGPKDTALGQLKRAGSDKSARSRQSSSRSMSFS